MLSADVKTRQCKQTTTGLKCRYNLTMRTSPMQPHCHSKRKQ